MKNLKGMGQYLGQKYAAMQRCSLPLNNIQQCLKRLCEENSAAVVVVADGLANREKFSLFREKSNQRIKEIEMSLIKNLIKEPEHKKFKRNKDEEDGNKSNEDSTEIDDKEKRTPPVIKSATDLQRLKIEKLMKNPDKPVIIPETSKHRDYMQTVPSFVRNVMGSSAGAGSGEFHVYRHLRRKEYARQKHIQAKSINEQLDEEFQKKLEENKRVAEEQTAKRRLLRWKKKEKRKQKKQQQKNNDGSEKEHFDHETKHPWSTEERIRRANDPFKRYDSDRETHLVEKEEEQHKNGSSNDESNKEDS